MVGRDKLLAGHLRAWSSGGEIGEHDSEIAELGVEHDEVCSGVCRIVRPMVGLASVSVPSKASKFLRAFAVGRLT